MAIKTYRPTTPSRRHMSVSGFDGVVKHVKPEKSLTEVLKKNAGRNSYGHITVRHQGGGNKKKYRIVDFRRDKLDVPATVLRLEYDPNRTAYIALVEYTDGERRYILAPVGLKVGDQILSSAAADILGGDLDHGDAEDLFDRLLDLDLVGVLGDLKGILLDVQVFHGLLGDDGADDDVVCGLHQANTSSILARAALSTTILPLVRTM